MNASLNTTAATVPRGPSPRFLMPLAPKSCKAWSSAEDKLLRACVASFGKRDWARVAGILSRRSARQCQARWYDTYEPTQMELMSVRTDLASPVAECGPLFPAPTSGLRTRGYLRPPVKRAALATRIDDAENIAPATNAATSEDANGSPPAWRFTKVFAMDANTSETAQGFRSPTAGPFSN